MASPEPNAAKKDSRDLFRLQFRKTRLCTFHMEGRCRYGNACGFAHEDAQMTIPPDLTKTSLCEKWQQGKCNHTAATCKFAHGKHELRITPQFARGRQSKKRTDKSQEKVTGKDAAKARRSKDKGQSGAATAPNMVDSHTNESLAEALAQIGTTLANGFALWEDDTRMSRAHHASPPPTIARTWIGDPVKLAENGSFGYELTDCSAPLPETAIPFPEKLTRKPFDWEGDTTTAGSSSDDKSSRSQSPSYLQGMVHAPPSALDNRFAFEGSGYSAFSGLRWNLASHAI
jgi:hypothetical protein|mmetsp:Transcript_30166/g.48672  ORF Transcript_30166/g.48672 Transcript_30166/m.48672 type:complete len:287 (-) Transcript_30166:67-927(-)